MLGSWRTRSPARTGGAQNAQRKIERLKAEQRRRERRHRLGIIGGVCAFALGAVALTAAFWPADKTSAGKTSQAASPSSATPVLAPASAQSGDPVDGIQSGSMEQLAFHIHAHLSIYVDGAQKAVPYSIGIIPPLQTATDAAGNPFAENGKGIYWLHTHDTSGIIHMEAPAHVSFTLGEFFDMWGQPLNTAQVGPAQGPLTVFVDGKAQTGDPRAIALTAHDVIQLDVGTAVPFQSFAFPEGL